MTLSEADARILEELKRAESQKIKVAVTDIDGVLRGKYLHKNKFLSAAEGTGFGFCNVVFGWDSSDVCYDNSTYTGWHTGYPDALAQVDLSTNRRVPWDGGIPFFLADFTKNDGSALEVCPRQLLKRVLKKTESNGFSAKVGMEFEWFNFRETPQTLAMKGYRSPEPLTPGMFGYSLLRASQNLPFVNAILDEMRAFGVPIEGLHTETGPGVFEAAILYSDALEAADRAVLFKSGVREIGARFGILPSFMAKWNAKLPGCSGHTHLSLWNADGSKNLFHEERDPHSMSRILKNFVAGILHCLPEVLPFFAPTVNSYKRFVDGYWAPTKPTWGIDNRTVALRVIPGNMKSTRLEVRVPGSDVNPYLAVAASIACGLYGIEKGLELKDSPAARFPRTLESATARLHESQIAHELFGAGFVDHFVRTRQWEWRQFQDAVTSWELERYFEII